MGPQKIGTSAAALASALLQVGGQFTKHFGANGHDLDLLIAALSGDGHFGCEESPVEIDFKPFAGDVAGNRAFDLVDRVFPDTRHLAVFDVEIGRGLQLEILPVVATQVLAHAGAILARQVRDDTLEVRWTRRCGENRVPHPAPDQMSKRIYGSSKLDEFSTEKIQQSMHHTCTINLIGGQLPFGN